jgi:hypothetical protein
MNTWTRIKNKLKYDNKLRIILDGIGKLGLKLSPHILMVESALFNKGYTLREADKFNDYTVSFLGLSDMEEILEMNRPGVTLQLLEERLESGNKCLAIKKDNRIVAFNWFDLTKAKWIERPLKNDEAYLFDMYTINEFRGLGLASFIRYKLYEELFKIGRTKLYSWSSLYNHSSIRFKEKLNAKRNYLILAVRIFNFWSHQFRIKTYPRTVLKN